MGGKNVVHVMCFVVSIVSSTGGGNWQYYWDIGLEVADVVIDKEPGGRPSGEAFVKFATKQHAELALERNRKHMGSRYGTGRKPSISSYFCIFGGLQ